MIIKTDINKKTQCVGSFTSEITGQFQLAGKKGPIYLFNFESLTEAGLVISNVLNGEQITIPESDIVKAKTLSGQPISYEKYDVVDAGTIVMAIMSTGSYEAVDNTFTPVTLTGVSISGTIASFTADGKTFAASDIFKKVGEGNFGK